MKLTFLGAAGSVTGSKYLVEAAGKRVLVDCGLFQGLKGLRLRNWGELPIDPKSLDAVILTHAHLDHSGYVPVLVKRGYGGPVYCTPPTLNLCKILLPDSGKLQEEEAEYANRKGFSKHHPALPLYTQRDAEACLRQFTSFGWGASFSLGEGFKFHFSRAGHILGAAFVTLEADGQRLVFSGDLGRQNDPILRAPEAIGAADYVVVESTYGGRAHPVVNFLDELEKAIVPVIEKGGVVVIPAFSVGRTQMLLHCLDALEKKGRLREVPIFLDSPMSVNATRILGDYPSEHRLSPADSRSLGDLARPVRTPDDSKALKQRRGPMIILSASGMATGGRVLHHLKSFGPHEGNLILFTGYQAAGTRGASLVSGDREVKIHGEMVAIRAKVANLESFSAHADENGILAWLSGLASPPKKIFITHGEPAAAQALKARIETDLSWTCEVPTFGQTTTV
jgi:metallo-beta-lactamase family protein